MKTKSQIRAGNIGSATGGAGAGLNIGSQSGGAGAALNIGSQSGGAGAGRT
jgi:hypothetical protein